MVFMGALLVQWRFGPPVPKTIAEANNPDTAARTKKHEERGKGRHRDREKGRDRERGFERGSSQSKFGMRWTLRTTSSVMQCCYTP